MTDKAEQATGMVALRQRRAITRAAGFPMTDKAEQQPPAWSRFDNGVPSPLPPDFP